MCSDYFCDCIQAKRSDYEQTCLWSTSRSSRQSAMIQSRECWKGKEKRLLLHFILYSILLRPYRSETPGKRNTWWLYLEFLWDQSKTVEEIDRLRKEPMKLKWLEYEGNGWFGIVVGTGYCCNGAIRRYSDKKGQISRKKKHMFWVQFHQLCLCNLGGRYNVVFHVQARNSLFSTFSCMISVMTHDPICWYNHPCNFCGQP